MTATNMCSNFSGFRLSPPLVNRLLLFDFLCEVITKHTLEPIRAGLSRTNRDNLEKRVSKLAYLSLISQI